MTVYTAIFSNYDDLKDPLVITPGWQYICFTDQPLQSKLWKVVHVEILPQGPQYTARWYKIMFHRHIQSEFSIWVDASFVINCNLDEWWQQFKEPITCIKHPLRNCVYKEAQACIDQGRGIKPVILKQIDLYFRIGIPKENGLIMSGILMRKLCQPVIDLCDIWWQQVSQHSIRDQIGFAYASWKMPIPYYIEYNYGSRTEFLYLYHLKSPKREKRMAYYKEQKLL